jgi:hypothetical protein
MIFKSLTIVFIGFIFVNIGYAHESDIEHFHDTATAASPIVKSVTDLQSEIDLLKQENEKLKQTLNKVFADYQNEQNQALLAEKERGLSNEKLGKTQNKLTEAIDIFQIIKSINLQKIDGTIALQIITGLQTKAVQFINDRNK